MPIESFHEIAKLLFADIRRRAAEAQAGAAAPARRVMRCVDFILLDQRVEIDLDLRSVLVRVDLK